MREVPLQVMMPVRSSVKFTDYQTVRRHKYNKDSLFWE